MQYTVAAAAKAAGISPWRLRTWERRYGIPSPDRSASGRRVYSEDDVAVIKRMASLVEQGFPASHAAETARVEAASDLPMPDDGSTEPDDPRITELIAAAGALDEDACTALIQDVVAELSWSMALERVLLPALRLIGVLWQRGEVSVMQEHFFSQLVLRELMHAIASAPPPEVDAPLVLLAGAEDEQHEIGLLALWLLLRERRIRVLCLGPDVPAGELAAAVEQARPAVVCLSATAATSAPMLGVSARALLLARTRARVFVGGAALEAPGAMTAIPATALPHPLGEAVDILVDHAQRANEADHRNE
jgi:MerR family transcriptional regulator, light-induced transcriptional regulator